MKPVIQIVNDPSGTWLYPPEKEIIPLVEGVTVEVLSHQDIRQRGETLKDWLAIKQIKYLDFIFTFDANLELVKVESVIIKQVYP